MLRIYIYWINRSEDSEEGIIVVNRTYGNNQDKVFASYTGALLPVEKSQNLTSGSIKDLSGNTTNPTVFGGTVEIRDAARSNFPLSQEISFKSSCMSRLSAPPDTKTWSFWFNISSWVDGHRMIEYSDCNDAGMRFMIVTAGSPNATKLYWNGWKYPDTVNVSMETSVPYWMVITTNITSNQTRLYINGELNATWNSFSISGYSTDCEDYMGITGTGCTATDSAWGNILELNKTVSDDWVRYMWQQYKSIGNTIRTEESPDSIAPTWSDNKTNASDLTKTQETVYFNITLEDNEAGGYYIFSFDNGTGSFVNDTAVAWATPQEIQIIRTITAIKGKIVRWKWYFNDTLGNNNETPIWSFVVANTAPTHTQPLLQATSLLNSTSDNLTCYNQSTSDADSDKVTNIYSWYKDSKPLASLYMPFEAGSNSTYTKDYSGNTNDGLVNGAIWTTKGKIAGAYEFDGSSYIAMKDSVSLNPNQITIEAWIKPSAFDDNDMFVSKAKSSEGKVDYDLRLVYGVPRFGFYDGTWRTVSASSSLTTGKWYHIAATHDGAVMRIYVDGNLSNTASHPYNLPDSSGDLRIGAYGWILSYFFNGTIDEVRIYPSVLSEEQIKQRYEETRDGLTTNSTILSQETTPGNTFLCQITVHDGESEGMTLNSSSLQVLWNISFDVRSGEDNTSLNNFDIYCNNSWNVIGVNSPYSVGFLPESYECEFEKWPAFYNKNVEFTANRDKTINVKMSKQLSLTIEEHNWLEALYECVINKNCEAFKLWENTNQTVFNIWKRVTRTDRSVVTQEEFISNTLSNTSNITINYTIQIPFKQGYASGELLPLRMYFWFTDINKTKCFDQDKRTDSNRAEAPYCFPLIAETIGPNNGSVNFVVDLRPSLPDGTYNITRAIEIDPILEGMQRWVNYGQEDIGGIRIEEGNEEPDIALAKTGETLPPKTGFLTGNAIKRIKDLKEGILNKDNLIILVLTLNTIVLIYLVIIFKKKL
jgi:hypothetical protein